jgi:hypothetical protein
VVETDGFTVADPEVALPVEKLVPAQEVAFEDDQVKVTAPPGATDVAEEERDAVGGGGVTVRVRLAFAVPPAPVQETEYVVDVDGETEIVPEVAFPVENPVPVQEVAFVELQVSEAEFPCTIDAGDAPMDAVGGAGGL